LDDYPILRHTTVSGELIGSFRDQPIYERLTDEFGRVYSYVGLAPCRRDGSFDVEAFGCGEFVLPPGLLYLCEETRAKSESARSSDLVTLI
jgi:hypothetical protein